MFLKRTKKKLVSQSTRSELMPTLLQRPQTREIGPPSSFCCPQRDFREPSFDATRIKWTSAGRGRPTSAFRRVRWYQSTMASRLSYGYTYSSILYTMHSSPACRCASTGMCCCNANLCGKTFTKLSLQLPLLIS